MALCPVNGRFSRFVKFPDGCLNFTVSFPVDVLFPDANRAGRYLQNHVGNGRGYGHRNPTEILRHHASRVGYVCAENRLLVRRLGIRQSVSGYLQTTI